MLEMRLPVGCVLLSEHIIANAHEVFRVLLLRRLGEIETPGKDRVAVDDHDLVMGDGVLDVDPDWNSGMSQERRRRIMSGAIAKEFRSNRRRLIAKNNDGNQTLEHSQTYRIEFGFVPCSVRGDYC